MMPTPFDIWLLARLDSVNAPIDPPLLARASDAIRPTAELLANTLFLDRGRILDAFLFGRPDGEAIREAMTHVKPTDPPPPDGRSDPAAGWEPIRLGELPPAEPFPLDVLPLPARDLAEAAAASIGCPVDFPAVAILAAASGAIGRSACLAIKPGYFESASLYAALVGGPSSGKSPALRAA